MYIYIYLRMNKQIIFYVHVMKNNGFTTKISNIYRLVRVSLHYSVDLVTLAVTTLD